MADELRARSSTSEPLGKVSEARVESAVPENVKQDMTVYWRLADFGSEAEFIRWLILKELYGSFNRLVNIAQREIRGHPGNTREGERGG